MFETVFQALFTYRPVVFEQGAFRFDPSAGAYVAALIGVCLVAAAVLTYRRVGGQSTPRSRAILLGLRLAIIAVVVVVLFGARKIPELMKGVGTGIKEFKKASKDEHE